MYIFNPEHDLCLANGDIHFVPPESALAFGRDCSRLTHFMYGLDNLADYDEPLPENMREDFGSGWAQNANRDWSATKKILPWGWNSVLRDRLIKEGCPCSLLPSDEVLTAIRELSDRRVAIEALKYLNLQSTLLNSPNDSVATTACTNLQVSPMTSCSPESITIFTGYNYRSAAGSLDEVRQFLKNERHVVLKAPLSGSGKGIRFVAEKLSHSDEGWCRNLIRKHGCVVVEKRFKPVLEFAMLFRCSCAKVEFVGYSLFYTHNGMYSGNVLASDSWIENIIVKYVPKESLDIAKNLLLNFIQEIIAEKYEGFVGVDQFAYLPYGDEKSASGFEYAESERIYGYNPVVEINLRMTMGLLAHNIYRLREKLHIDTTEADALEKITDGSHYFEICRAKKGSKEHYSYVIGATKR